MNEGFLSRWSRRKHDSRKDDEAPEQETSQSPQRADATSPAPSPAQPLPPASVDAEAQSAGDGVRRDGERRGTAPELPPIESLTPESDFRAFMRSGVDGSTRNAALAQLFRDPRYNEMDGLDVYIGDYTQSEPIPPPMLAKLKKLHDIGFSDEGSERRDALADNRDALADNENDTPGAEGDPADEIGVTDATDAPGATDPADAAVAGADQDKTKPQETQG